MRLYPLLDTFYKRLKSVLLVADLKLKGGGLPWSTQIGGRVSAADSSRLNIGRDVIIGKNVMFNMADGEIVIGDNCVVADNTRWDVMGGKIVLGRGVLTNSHSIVTAWRGVSVGDKTLVAPFCHITDRVHGLSQGASVNEQPGEAKPIKIGSDVWIASSCIVLKGVKIGN
jgi:acetyltransferase-like isoleucine patch superfamily enzyme